MNSRQSVGNASATVGIVPRQVQLDFEKEEKKVQQFDSTNKKFYKDVKCYVDKIDELNKSETKMINNLSNLVNTSSPNSSNSSSNNTVSNHSLNSSTSTQNNQKSTTFNNTNQQQLLDMTNLNIANTDSNDQEFLCKLKQWKDLLQEHSKSCDTLKQACQSQVVEPMKNLNSVFPRVYAAIKRREQICKELFKQQEKLDKAQEKERTGANLVKITELTQAVNTAKQQFQKEHLFLMEELPKFYDSRIDYIGPCINSLIQSQSVFYEKYASFYDSILNSTNDLTTASATNSNPLISSPSFSTSSSNSSASSFLSAKVNTNIDKIDQDIQKCLNDIKSLSIVAGD